MTEQVDEVERAVAPADVRWSGLLDERLEDARALVAGALDSVRGGAFEFAAEYLRGLGELVVEDPTAGLNGDVEDDLRVVDAVCVRAAATDGDVSVVQAALLVRFWVAWVSGDPVEDQFGFLDRAVGLEGEGSFALGCEARLRRASELDRRGAGPEAVAEFDALLSRLKSAPTVATPELLTDVWYERCIGRSAAEEWEQAGLAADAVAAFYEQIENPAPVMQLRFAEARWVRCIVLARSGKRLARRRAEDAMAALDELIDWLRSGTEPGLRRLLVRRLADKMRWLGNDVSAIDVVEEMTTGVLDLNDRGLTRFVGRQLAEHLPDLALPSPGESAALTEVFAASAGGEIGVLPTPDWLPLGESASRSERLLWALSALRVRLAADEDPRAVPVRALVLINEMVMLGRLGLGAEQVRRVEDLVNLGEPGLAACDEVALHPLALQGEGVYPVTIGMPILKATLLAEWGRLDEALATYSQVIDEFSDLEEPWVQAMLHQARGARQELED